MSDLFDTFHAAVEGMADRFDTDIDLARSLRMFGFDLLADLEDPPEVEWLIEGVWPAGSFGMWGAPEKSFKSYLTTYGAICVAAGIPFLGRSVKQGTVIVFSGEGAKHLYHRRARKIAAGLGVDLRDIPLAVTDKVESTADEELIEVFGAACEVADLVIMDPWYVFNGAAGEAGNVYLQGAELKKLSRLSTKYNAALWLPHHFRKRDVAAGTSLQDLTQAGGREWVDSWVLIDAAFDKESRRASIKLEGGSRQSDDVDLPSIVHLDLSSGGAVFSTPTQQEVVVIKLTEHDDRRSAKDAEKVATLVEAFKRHPEMRAGELRDLPGITTRDDLDKLTADLPVTSRKEGRSKVYTWSETA